MIDAGRDWAWALALAGGGRRLYLDLSYHHGPFAPYANAALLRLFGPSLWTLIGAGLALAAAATASLYKLARRALGPFPALAVGCVFIFGCAFAHLSTYASYNFILPYSWAATYGLVVSLASLGAALKWAESPESGPPVLAAAGFAAACLCKLEIAAALAAALACVAWREDGHRRRQALASGATALGVAAAVYGCFAVLVGPRELMTRNLLIAHNLIGASQLRGTGLTQAPANLARMALSAAGTAAALLPALWAPEGALGAAAASLLAGASAWVLGPDLQFRAAPFLLGAALLWRRRAPGRPKGLSGRFASGWDRRGGESAPGLREQAPVIIFGLSMLARIALDCAAHHYGFYMLAAALPAYGWALWHWLPFAAARRPSRAYASACLAFLCAGALQHALWSQRNYRRQTINAVGARGRLLLEDGNRGRALARTVELLSSPELAGKSLVAIPEGAGLGFLGGQTYPVALDCFLPRDLSTGQDEARAIGLLEAARPELALVVPRDVSEFGVLDFPRGYGGRVADWLKTRYRLERMVESARPSEPAFRVAILRRL